jgi:hypothetical protein
MAPSVATGDSMESTPGAESVMVMGESLGLPSSYSIAEQAVNGVPKPLGEIDDDDEANMTTEEYEVSQSCPESTLIDLCRRTQMRWLS